jgi:hypothetical protein
MSRNSQSRTYVYIRGREASLSKKGDADKKARRTAAAEPVATDGPDARLKSVRPTFGSCGLGNKPRSGALRPG